MICSHHARRAALAVLPILVWGCADSAPAPAESAAARASQAIVGGQIDTQDGAVVALTADGHAYCTGTLIHPTVVLTAAHCLPPNIPSYATDYSDIAVFFGSDVVQGGVYVAAADGWTDPAWNIDAVDDDVGLLRLETTAPVTPLAVNSVALEAPQDIGTTLRIVGFGMTGENEYGSVGVKRQASAPLQELFQSVFTMTFEPFGTCSGDSGGTALMMRDDLEVVAGIHSRSDCVSVSVDTRVDAYVNEIMAFVLAADCGADGLCAVGCAAADPDCPCAEDGFCSDSCFDPAGDPDCSACQPDGVCEAGCTTDPDCEACPADGYCDELCGNDPDCGCDSCGDPWYAGGATASRYQGNAVSGGCSAGQAPSEPDADPRAIVALLIGLGLLLRRKPS